MRRIINIPKRGIGAATLAKVQGYANEHGISFYQALRGAPEIPSIGRAAAKIEPFVTLIQAMRSKAGLIPVSALLQEIIDTTGYIEELEAEGTDEAKARIENIEELQGKVLTYEEKEPEPTLSGFLEEVALVADIDSLDADSDHVVLMTLHSAKGLEFPQVYLAGMEDGLFPSYMSITSDNAMEEIEEERRLAYVGITRAMERLAVTCAKQRMVRGETQYNKVSRFVKEIPQHLLEEPVPKARRAAVSGYADSLRQQAREAFLAKPAAMAGSRSGSVNFISGNNSVNFVSGNNSVDSASGSGSVNFVSGNNSVNSASGSGSGSAISGNNNVNFVSGNNSGNAISGNDGGTVSGSGSPGGSDIRRRLGYDVGDLVRHQKFGEGLVVKIVSGGRDYEVTVQFHEDGVKKMFDAFAKLKRAE